MYSIRESRRLTSWVTDRPTNRSSFRDTLQERTPTSQATMSSQSVLYPPNASHLTSEVIRNVTERSTPKFDGVGMTASHSVLHVHGLSTTVSTTISSPQYVRLTDSHAPVRSTPQAVALAGAPSAPGGFLPAVGCTTTTAGLPTTSTRPQAASAQAKDEDAATIEARRQRHRVHQERYRRKLRLNLQEHQQSIQDLHEEIQWLELQRQITALYASMGVDALLENWRYLSLGLKGADIQLECLENGVGGSVIATSSTTFTVTENTLRMVFPHLLECDEGGRLHPIATKLLGQQLSVKSSAEFQWDDERGQMSSIQLTPDFFTPLLRILGALEDVAFVFSKARMTSECKAVC
ncbi:hypothetical protein PHYSODRAFT_362029 [Phytophthora sojae]|uniref:BZIP domain-containing protein n=1 Tax=Phytophthora sojae (strain P6497) TaxID=1094619 RepID=G5A6Q5_PHYSP|nr:hypothetical protein PHYSODRAFT_362029 [Phytophthora sojae]EGZ09010.1 hypothetical protein PHYSODRAFT_362029 [Phytophthora sojae]|eukprot:XP_009535643.1 hypothetical protein PHYSODRAFT_362029 [Phytophthora sojae]